MKLLNTTTHMIAKIIVRLFRSDSTVPQPEPPPPVPQGNPPWDREGKSAPKIDRNDGQNTAKRD
jgi:hypothetical protein